MIEIVYATPEMLAAVDGPQRQTVRAIAVLRDGELSGIAGYFVHGGNAILFGRKIGNLPAKTVVRATRMAIGMAEESGLPILALPDPEVDGSRRLLEHVGFHFKE